MQTAQFDYRLPPELIAQQPLPQRDQSRLLVLDRAKQTIQHSHFRLLKEHLDPGDCLVLNNSRVIPAKFTATRTTGGKVQGLFLAESDGIWQVMLKPSARLRESESLNFIGHQAKLVLLESQGKGLWLAQPEPPSDNLQILEQIGHTPLPPYIKRDTNTDTPTDRQRYQTVFASNPGSVAAPTAGLHFSEQTLKDLQASRIDHAYVTLHVGLGTFAPIKADSLDQHQMHREWFSISDTAVEQIRSTRKSSHRTVAVGTTSLRVLEAASVDGLLNAQQGWTDIFIKPGHRFVSTDALLTNFHLPRSTLLVLVCALASQELIFEAYRQAIERKYRFYSYGDAMLIL